MEDLQHKITEIESKPGSRIEPLPEIKPYDAFIYNAIGLRSPFVQSAPAQNDAANGLRPDSNRPREFLEQFPLDTLRMVGTLKSKSDGRLYALVRDKDGLIHRALPGSYLGQNDGRILSITNSKISVVEVVPDGVGGYIERPASIPLNE